MKEEKEITVHKSGPSNLLVDRTKSINFCVVICSKG